MKPTTIAIAVAVGVIALFTTIIVATLIYTNAHELKGGKARKGPFKFEWSAGSKSGSSTATTAGPKSNESVPIKQDYKPTPTATPTQEAENPHFTMIIKGSQSPEPAFYFKPGTLKDQAVPVRQRIIQGHDCDCYRVPQALAFDATQLPRRWDLYVIKPDPNDQRPWKLGQVKLCIPHHSARFN